MLHRPSTGQFLRGCILLLWGLVDNSCKTFGSGSANSYLCKPRKTSSYPCFTAVSKRAEISLRISFNRDLKSKEIGGRKML